MIVVLPTDTVYGLAALPRTARGRRPRSSSMKGRPDDVPIAVLCRRRRAGARARGGRYRLQSRAARAWRRVLARTADAGARCDGRDRAAPGRARRRRSACAVPTTTSCRPLARRRRLRSPTTSANRHGEPTPATTRRAPRASVTASRSWSTAARAVRESRRPSSTPPTGRGRVLRTAPIALADRRESVAALESAAARTTGGMPHVPQARPGRRDRQRPARIAVLRRASRRRARIVSRSWPSEVEAEEGAVLTEQGKPGRSASSSSRASAASSSAASDKGTHRPGRAHRRDGADRPPASDRRPSRPQTPMKLLALDARAFRTPARRDAQGQSSDHGAARGARSARRTCRRLKPARLDASEPERAVAVDERGARGRRTPRPSSPSARRRRWSCPTRAGRRRAAPRRCRSRARLAVVHHGPGSRPSLGPSCSSAHARGEASASTSSCALGPRKPCRRRLGASTRRARAS